LIYRIAIKYLLENIPKSLVRYLKFILECRYVGFHPKQLPIWVIFTLLYIPFLMNYGWEYMNITHVDLPTFYSAGVEVFQNGNSPYSYHTLQKQMGQGYNVYPYLYPPPSLLFFYPLSLVEYSSAQFIILVINHLLVLLLLGFFMHFLSRSAKKANPMILILTLVYVLTFNPIIITLNHGQVNMLLLVFLCGFWIYTNRRKPITGSFFLAMAILLKTYPILLLPVLMVVGRKREIFYTLAWLGAGVLLSVIILPVTLWQEWFTQVLPSGGYGHTPKGLFSPAAIWNQSLNGYFSRAFTQSKWSNPGYINEGLAVILTYVSAGLIYLITLFAVWNNFRVGEKGITKMFMAFLPAMFLMAPLSWKHHLVYLLPSILLLLNAKSKLSRFSTLFFHAACVLAALIIAFPFFNTLKFYAVLGIWCLSIYTLLIRRIEITDSQN